MRYTPFLMMALFLFSVNVQAALYEWKDDRGVVNFTDNPANIPTKYRNRVKKRPSINVENVETSSDQGAGESSQAVEPTPSTSESQASFGGHNEDWWRSRFSSIRDELKATQDGLPAKQEQLEAARRKMTIYSFPRYRKAYYDLLADIEKDNAKIKDLNSQLETLDNEASKAGVPFNWRQ
jgi:hypothetical protein